MIEKLEEFDKSFSEGLFLTKVDHIFIMLLTSIMEKNIDRVKHYLSNDVYLRYKQMVDKYKEDETTRLFDEMNVKSTQISNVEINENEIIVTVNLTSRYMDYIIDKDGNYVSGENTRRIEKSNLITFTKKINAESLKAVRKCPSCGSSLDLNDTAVCKYCHQPFDMSKYDYIITDIKTY